MRKASTELLEQGIQAPSPAPDLIPAEHQSGTYIGIGTTNGGTSGPPGTLPLLCERLLISYFSVEAYTSIFCTLQRDSCMHSARVRSDRLTPSIH